MILFIDNFDSFTYNIVQVFRVIGKEICIFRNNEITISKCLQMKIDLIVVGPGPRSIEDTGISIDLIRFFSNKIPILGICLGHQAIGHAFGAKIIKASLVMHGKTSKITHNQSGIFQNIKQNVEMMRYHSLVIDKKSLPDCLDVLAYSNDDEQIMAIKHQKYPIYGVQFHPESILSNEISKFFNNILKMCKKC